MTITALTTTEVKGTAFDDSQRPDARTKINEIITDVNAHSAALLESDWLDSVNCAADANVNIAVAPATIDGVAAGATISAVLTGQTDAKENGLYDYLVAGAAMTRRADFDTTAEVTSGATVRSTQGTRFAGVVWYVSAADPITVGTSNITFGRSSALKGFVGAGSPGVGDDVADGYSPGSTWLDTDDGSYYIANSVGAGAAVWREVEGLRIAATIPLVTSDDSEGHHIGSGWYDTALAREFRCTDATTGAAVWDVVGVIESAAAPAVGDDDADWISAGQLWYDTTTGIFYRAYSVATGAAVWNVLNDLTIAATIPLVTSDDVNGFRIGSSWYDTALARLFTCTDATTGAAVWGVFGRILAATSPGVGDDDADWIGVGQTWFDSVLALSFICTDNTTGAAVWTELGDIHVAATIPLVTSDDAAGFRIGSEWYDTALNRKFRATDVTTGAAVWEIVGGVTAATAPGVGDDDADWFVAGNTWHDNVTHITYTCASAATGVAIWLVVGKVALNLGAVPTITDDIDAGYSPGDLWFYPDVTAYMCIVAAVGAAVWVPLYQTFVRNTAPTVTDDDSLYYADGASWYDSVTLTMYILDDNTTGAAVWTAVGDRGGAADFCANGMFRATYDYATHGGIVGSNPFGPELPDNAFVMLAHYEVQTTFQSTTGPDNATVGLGVTTADAQGIVALAAINGGVPWDADGATRDTLCDNTAAGATTKSAARLQFNLEIGVEIIDAGRLVVFGTYVTGE